MIRSILNGSDAAELLSQQALEFAVINNPEGSYPPAEICPMAPIITTPRESLAAVLMDMDGTIADTTGLNFFSLEHTIRRISGRMRKEDWRGLDELIDLPSIIANRPEQQVEFLISRYSNFIKADHFRDTFFFAALKTLISGRDEKRKEYMRQSMRLLGLARMLEDARLREYIEKEKFNESANAITGYFISQYGSHFNTSVFSSMVRAACDIYYHIYHEILDGIATGHRKSLYAEMPEETKKHLITPMPGLSVFIAILKGWLGEDIRFLYEHLQGLLRLSPHLQHIKHDRDIITNKLIEIGGKFSLAPAKIGLVTSMTPCECNIVLDEIFPAMIREIDDWKIPSEKKNLLKEKFGRSRHIFDTIVTADDSSDIRPKPYRDLYSIALGHLGLVKNTFQHVLGFESTPSGIVALRAAGIGYSVALPPAKAADGEFPGASCVARGGLPECMIDHNLFIK